MAPTEPLDAGTCLLGSAEATTVTIHGFLTLNMKVSTALTPSPEPWYTEPRAKRWMMIFKELLIGGAGNLSSFYVFFLFWFCDKI